MERQCIDSYKKIFPPAEYDYFDYDITQEANETFCKSLGIICEALHNYEYIGLYFDDLSFLPSSIIKSENIVRVFTDYKVDYLRWNAYPPGDDLFAENPSFSFINSDSPYVFSLVASFFRRSILKDLCLNQGLSSAWDIEKFRPEYPIKAVCLNGRPLRYNNLIVKGKIDGIAILRCSISHNLIRSLRLLLLESILYLAYKYKLTHVLLQKWQKRKSSNQ